MAIFGTNQDSSTEKTREISEPICNSPNSGKILLFVIGLNRKYTHVLSNKANFALGRSVLLQLTGIFRFLFY